LVVAKCDKVKDSAKGRVELVKIDIAIMMRNTSKKLSAQKIPKKPKQPKKAVNLIQRDRLSVRSASQPHIFGAKILLN
jgi:hypothetical protein